MAALINEIEENGIVLVLASDPGYAQGTAATVKALAAKRAVCYITLNKTAGYLQGIFKKNGVNLKNVVFVDAVTRTIKDGPSEGDGTYFVPSPAALTEISMLFERLLKHGFMVFIFDALTNVRIYQKEELVTEFALHIFTRIREAKAKAVVYMLDMPGHETMIRECSMMADRVIREEPVR